MITETQAPAMGVLVERFSELIKTTSIFTFAQLHPAVSSNTSGSQCGWGPISISKYQSRSIGTFRISKKLVTLEPRVPRKSKRLSSRLCYALSSILNFIFMLLSFCASKESW